MGSVKKGTIFRRLSRLHMYNFSVSSFFNQSNYDLLSPYICKHTCIILTFL